MLFSLLPRIVGSYSSIVGIILASAKQGPVLNSICLVGSDSWQLRDYRGIGVRGAQLGQGGTTPVEHTYCYFNINTLAIYFTTS